jgi:hypothetical protein
MMKSHEIVHEQHININSQQHININSRKTRDTVRGILREKFRK